MPDTPDKHSLEKAIGEQLARDARVDSSDLHVSVTDDAVELHGDVSSHIARRAAMEIAEALADGRKVDSQLSVRRTSEASTAADEVTSAVESVLEWLPDVEIENRRVRVVDGVVFIEGTVDANWKRARVGEAIRNVYGVVELEDRLVVASPGTDDD